MSPCQAIRGY